MSYFNKRTREQNKFAKEDVWAQFPSNALVELSNSCNHKCIFCYNTIMKRKIGILDKSLYERFIKEGVENGLREVGLYTTGEPFVVKDLADYIAIAKENGISRVYITSNGSMATKEAVLKCLEAGLDSIKFSVNAAEREQYKIVHGVDDWDKVVKNIEDCWSLKQEWKHLQLIGSCVMSSKTGDIESAHSARFGQYMEDIQYSFAGSQAGRNGNYLDSIKDSNRVNDIEETEACWMLWKRLHLTCEGYLTACCVDYELDLVYGKMTDGKLIDIWNNEVIRGLRDRHLKKNLLGTICYDCLTCKTSKYKPITELPEHIGIRHYGETESYKKKLDLLKGRIGCE